MFCYVDDALTGPQKSSQALPCHSETVTLGLGPLFALQGVGNRAFYRWAKVNLKPLLPGYRNAPTCSIRWRLPTTEGAASWPGLKPWTASMLN